VLTIDHGFALQRKFQRQCVWIEGRHVPSTHIFLATHSTSVADSVRSPAAAPSTIRSSIFAERRCANGQANARIFFLKIDCTGPVQFPICGTHFAATVSLAAKGAHLVPTLSSGGVIPDMTPSERNLCADPLVQGGTHNHCP